MWIRKYIDNIYPIANWPLRLYSRLIWFSVDANNFTWFSQHYTRTLTFAKIKSLFLNMFFFSQLLYNFYNFVSIFKLLEKKFEANFVVLCFFNIHVILVKKKMKSFLILMYFYFGQKDRATNPKDIEAKGLFPCVF